MSTTRIKYTKQKDGTDKSIRLYSTRYKTYYYVVKDERTEIKSFKIVNVNQRRVVYELENSSITNKAVLYRNIRDKLKDLGVELKTEIRPHQRVPTTEQRSRGGRNNSKLAKERRMSPSQVDVTDE